MIHWFFQIFKCKSLDKLASYHDKDKLKIVRSEFYKLRTKDFDLLTRKDVFPYEYIDCVEKLQDMRLSLHETYFPISWQAILYPRMITLTQWKYGSDSPSERSASTVICTWKLVSCY